MFGACDLTQASSNSKEMRERRTYFIAQCSDYVARRLGAGYPWLHHVILYAT